MQSLRSTFRIVRLFPEYSIFERDRPSPLTALGFIDATSNAAGRSRGWAWPLPITMQRAVIAANGMSINIDRLQYNLPQCGAPLQ
jgi:hypothetical protein